MALPPNSFFKFSCINLHSTHKKKHHPGLISHSICTLLKCESLILGIISEFRQRNTVNAGHNTQVKFKIIKWDFGTPSFEIKSKVRKGQPDWISSPVRISTYLMPQLFYRASLATSPEDQQFSRTIRINAIKRQKTFAKRIIYVTRLNSKFS